MDVDELKRSYENVDLAWEYFSGKYGEQGAERILSNKLVIYALSKGFDNTRTVGDKIAIFNGIKPI